MDERDGGCAGGRAEVRFSVRLPHGPITAYDRDVQHAVSGLCDELGRPGGAPRWIGAARVLERVGRGGEDDVARSVRKLCGTPWSMALPGGPPATGTLLRLGECGHGSTWEVLGPSDPIARWVADRLADGLWCGEVPE